MEKQILEAIETMRAELTKLEKLVEAKRWEVEYREPTEVRGALNARYPFSSMHVGAMWRLPDDADWNKAIEACRKVSQRKGFKFTYDSADREFLRYE